MCNMSILTLRQAALRRRAGAKPTSPGASSTQGASSSQTSGTEAGATESGAVAGLHGSRHDAFDRRDTQLAPRDATGFDPAVSQASLLGM